MFFLLWKARDAGSYDEILYQQDYTFFLNHNSAELMRDINTDPEMFYAAVLNMLQLMSELCVSLILVGYLLVKDAPLTLGVAFAMVVMVFIFMKNCAVP